MPHTIFSIILFYTNYRIKQEYTLISIKYDNNANEFNYLFRIISGGFKNELR